MNSPLTSNKIKDSFPILVETTEILPAMIDYYFAHP